MRDSKVLEEVSDLRGSEPARATAQPCELADDENAVSDSGETLQSEGEAESYASPPVMRSTILPASALPMRVIFSSRPWPDGLVLTTLPSLPISALNVFFATTPSWPASWRT